MPILEDPKPEYDVGDVVIVNDKEGVIKRRRLQKIDEPAMQGVTKYWDYLVEFPDGTKSLHYEDELN